ncbi:MAG TPA: CDP-alcohol phosphatidyltransferase family protein [Vicinamibacterales bacterium]
MSHSTAQANGAHSRENHGLLARAEKRTLIWLAHRLPDAIDSDHLSALGLGAMLAVGLSFAAFRLTPWAAAGVVISLALNWFGDSLDGTVARVRDRQRPRYGYYVDHVIDLAGTTFLMTGLACSGLMNPLLAILLLAAYLLVSAETYLATHARGVFRMSFLGFGPTELRIVLAVGALKAAYDPWVFLGNVEPMQLFDVGAVIASIGLVAVFIASAVRNTRALYAAEPLPTGALAKVGLPKRLGASTTA